MFSYYLMPIIFVLGILGIAFEEQIKINKTATALLTCVLLWCILLVDTNIAASRALSASWALPVIFPRANMEYPIIYQAV